MLVVKYVKNEEFMPKLFLVIQRGREHTGFLPSESLPDLQMTKLNLILS